MIDFHEQARLPREKALAPPPDSKSGRFYSLLRGDGEITGDLYCHEHIWESCDNLAQVVELSECDPIKRCCVCQNEIRRDDKENGAYDHREKE